MRFCLLTIALILCQLVHSKTIDLEKAKIIAVSTFEHEPLTIEETNDNYVVFSKGKDNGYVIVGASHEDALRIIGYSDFGNWDFQKLPPCLKQWIDCFNRNTYSKRVNDEKRTALTRSSDNRVSIPTLLKTSWHQGYPYNKFSPFVVDGNIQSIAGCVAIAASQIVYYWNKDNPSGLVGN